MTDISVIYDFGMAFSKLICSSLILMMTPNYRSNKPWFAYIARFSAPHPSNSPPREVLDV
jgi:hypothetical protein